MKFLRIILSWFYGLGVFVRNALYDERLLMSSYASVPTIGVGNLAMGGTGKTPHTEFIARQLQKRFRVAILSRGYKRKTKGFVLADSDSTAQTIGDEPMQMHLNLPEIPVAVCENRLQGIRHLQRMYPDLQVVLLDDAFQHRRLSCGFYILLTPSDNLYVNDHFFPRGKLRDSRHASLRANMIVVTKCPENMQPIDKRVIETSLHLPQYQQLFFSYIKNGELMPVWSDEGKLPVEGRKPLVLTGIENPEPLIEYLNARYEDVATLRFADHHDFRKRDFARMKSQYEQLGCDFILTTQKDATRLLASKYFPEEFRSKTYMLPVYVDFKGQESGFMQPIIQYVAENNRKKKTN